jgi:hypothetical protein
MCVFMLIVLRYCRVSLYCDYGMTFLKRGSDKSVTESWGKREGARKK